VKEKGCDVILVGPEDPQGNEQRILESLWLNFNLWSLSFKFTFTRGSPRPHQMGPLASLYVHIVTDEKGLGQQACPKEWKKYEGGNEE
jgi:hypothetical protein